MATSSANDQDGHLQKRFSKITMIGMAFAILKLVIDLELDPQILILTLFSKYLDLFSWVHWSGDALGWVGVLCIRLHLLCHLQHRLECECWRACIALSDSWRTVSLCLCTFDEEVEEDDGKPHVSQPNWKSGANKH